VQETLAFVLTALLNAWFILVKRTLRSDGHDVIWFGAWFSDVTRAFEEYSSAEGDRRARYRNILLTGFALLVGWLACVGAWMS
jgi:hypothetical protein